MEILDVKADLIKDNDQEAARIRRSLEKSRTFLVNLMGSPGAGKTTVLTETIRLLKNRYAIGVMEADVDSDVDARAMEELGVRTIQLHTGGSCHMDARMTGDGLAAMSCSDLDLVFLENVGNLVCPAEFDVGAALSVMILSVPEGDDKPLKYPLMFSVSDCLLVNKTDTSEIFDFDMDRCIANVRMRNTEIPVFPVAAVKGLGIPEWTEWLTGRIKDWKKTVEEADHGSDD